MTIKLTRKTFDHLFDYSMLTVGVFCIVIAMNVFITNHSLSFGGITGLAIVLLEIFNIPIWLTYSIANAILFFIANKYTEKRLMVRSIYCIVLISVFLKLGTNFSYPVTDIITASIFGGILLGMGMALILCAEGSTGGTDFLSKIIFEKTGFPIPTSIIIIDGLIILSGFIVFGLNKTLYGLILVVCISSTIKKATKEIDNFIRKYRDNDNV